MRVVPRVAVGLDLVLDFSKQCLAKVVAGDKTAFGARPVEVVVYPNSYDWLAETVEGMAASLSEEAVAAERVVVRKGFVRRD